MNLERGSHGVASAATALTVFAVMGKLVAFVQESAVAAMFGAGRDVDLIISGRLIPSFVGGVLGASIGVAVIPIIQQAQKGSEPGHIRTLLQGAFLAITTVMAVGALSCLILGDSLLRAIAPGYSSQDRDVLGQLTLASFAVATVDTACLLLIAVLHAQRRFVVGALASMIGPALGLVAVITLSVALGMWGIIAGWGVASGIQFALLGWLLRKELSRPTTPSRTYWWDGVMAAKAGLPILLFAVVANIVTFVDRGIASTLGPGSVALVNWAQKVYNLPLGLVIVPLATAVYPFLAEVPREEKSLRRVNMGIGATAFLLVPASLLIVLLREQLTVLLFQRGAFTGVDTGRLTHLLAGYGAGLLFIGGFTVLVRISYGLGRKWEPLWVAMLGSILYIPLASVLSERVGVSGLAIAYSTVMCVSCVVLGVLVYGAARGAVSVSLGRELITLGIAGLGMATMIVGSFHVLTSMGTGWRSNPALAVVFVSTAGLGAYWTLCHVFGSEVLRRLTVELRRVVAVNAN